MHCSAIESTRYICYLIGNSFSCENILVTLRKWSNESFIFYSPKINNNCTSVYPPAYLNISIHKFTRLTSISWFSWIEYFYYLHRVIFKMTFTIYRMSKYRHFVGKLISIQIRNKLMYNLRFLIDQNYSRLRNKY